MCCRLRLQPARWGGSLKCCQGKAGGRPSVCRPCICSFCCYRSLSLPEPQPLVSLLLCLLCVSRQVEMDSFRFAKLVRESGLLGGKLTTTGVDLAFTKCKTKVATRCCGGFVG